MTAKHQHRNIPRQMSSKIMVITNTRRGAQVTIDKLPFLITLCIGIGVLVQKNSIILSTERAVLMVTATAATGAGAERVLRALHVARYHLIQHRPLHPPHHHLPSPKMCVISLNMFWKDTNK